MNFVPINCQVTPSHLFACNHSAKTCPIATAISNRLRFSATVTVCSDHFTITTGSGELYVGSMPTRLGIWVQAYDQLIPGVAAYPFEFTVSVPDWAVEGG